MTPTTKNIGHLITERDIHAYVDGELLPTRRAQVEAHLAIHPEDAARARCYRNQNIGMHVLFDGLAEEALPLHLMECDDERPGPRRVWRSRLLRAVPAFLLVGGLLATFAWPESSRDPPQEIAASDAFLRDATAAYQRLTDPGIISAATGFKASESAQWLDSPSAGAWLVPDLSSAGFRTTGGRMLNSADRPAAHLAYRDADGSMITLYITRNADTARGAGGARSAFTFIRRDDMSLLYWETGALTYALIGQFTRRHLFEIAGIVMDQVELMQDRAPRAAGRDPPLRPSNTRQTVNSIGTGAELRLPQLPAATSPDKPRPAATIASPIPMKLQEEPGRASPAKPEGSKEAGTPPDPKCAGGQPERIAAPCIKDGA